MKTQRIIFPGVAILAASLAFGGCGDDDGTEPEAPAADEVAASTRNNLVWKRYNVIERDLSRALELAPEELCQELGTFGCIREAHLVTLGGHDPIHQGLYEPLAEPLVTTSLALDRIALSACRVRVDLDRTTPVVFTALDLDGPAPDAESEAFSQTVESLYRRLLSRDPLATEVDVIADLLVDEQGGRVSSADFAQLACFVVTTTTEFLFV